MDALSTGKTSSDNKDNTYYAECECFVQKGREAVNGYAWWTFSAVGQAPHESFDYPWTGGDGEFESSDHP
jgi:hypothetical protein